MGGRSSKVTVVQVCDGDSPPTDADLLKAIRSEYANAKHRNSAGKVAWDFQEYALRIKERDSDEVFLVDKESTQDSNETTTPPGGGGLPAGNTDKHTHVQAPGQAASGFEACVRETVAEATTSPSALHTQQHVNGAGRTGERKGVASPADGINTKSLAVASACESLATGAASKHKRPATGNPKHGRHKTEGKTHMTAHPPAASPVGAAAATAAAATSISGSSGRDHGGAQNAASIPTPTTDRTSAVVPATAQTNLAGKADAAPAAPAALTNAQALDSAVTAGVANSVQWVIRPGPPIESAYRVGKVLGQGSFGMVRAATHIATGAEVAVKTIRKSLLRAADVTSLRREVEILHHLSGHPHISQILGVYEEARQLHLVLELYKGGDLFDAIIGNGRHSERTAADVMRTLLTAIAYCHAMGVAHRDIKPENFMLTAELPEDFQDKQAPTPQQQQQQQASGGRQIPLAPPMIGIGARLKLIDFGLSTFCTDDTPLTEIVGTSYYVAPEVLDARYNLPADVWSAGVILFIMLTGYAPFDGKDDREILRAVRKGNLDLSKDPVWKSISPDAAAVVTAMLNRDPKRRATADQILSMPWIGRTADVCVAPTAPLPGVVSERLHRFARMSSFKKEARRVVAGLMRPEEVAGLVAQFQGLDVDKDGRINLAELREGLARQSLLHKGASVREAQLSEEQLRDLLRRSDLNGDGLLDESEFLGAALPAAALARQALAGTAAGGSRPASSHDQLHNPLKAAFKHFDLDGSGYITVEELGKALATHHPSGKATDFAALLARHDQDKDGLISYPEFVEMLVQDVDGEDDDGVMCDAAVHGLPRQAPLRPSASGSNAGRSSNHRITTGEVRGNVSRDDGGSSRTLRSRESAMAWGVGGPDPNMAGAVTNAAAAKVRGDGRAAVAGGSGSPFAAQMPGTRISSFEWADECSGSGDDGTAATAMTVAVGRYDTVLDTGVIKPSDATMMGAPQAAAARSSANGGSIPVGIPSSAAPRIPSRLSQTQLPPNSLQPFSAAARDPPASALTSQLSLRIGSGNSNRRASIGEYCPSPSEGLDSGSGGINRLGEAPELTNGQPGVYGGFLNGVPAPAPAAATSSTQASPSQRSGQRVPPPPRLQLPVQPAADLRSRRHSAGGMVPDSRGLLVVIGGDGGSSGTGSGGGSPVCHGDLRPAAHASRHNPAAGRGLTTPGAPVDMGVGYNFNDLQGTPRAVAGDASVTTSLPGSPSAAAVPATAQRIMAGRLSTGSGAATPSPQHQRNPALQPLYMSHLGQQAMLPTLPMQLAPAGAGDRLTEHASCPLTTLSGWPLSPGGPAPARPSRASVTGMMPVRGPGLWPAPVTSVTSSGGAVRPAPPSEPLPVLHTIGMRSRRQSTGSPALPLFHPTVPSAAVTPQLLPVQQQQPAGQHAQRHNLSISCNGGASCSSNGNSNNTLSPRVPTPVLSDWPSGGATPMAGRRSRRTTQPGLLLPSGGEDLIFTSRASIDLDVGASTADEALNNYVLPPGATGLGFGAQYKPLLTSGSGRLL